jgi:hypothetical protein
MAENEPGTLTDTVSALAGQIAGLRGEIQDMDISGRRTRRLIRRQWALTIVLAAVAIFALRASIVAGGAASAAQRNAVNAEQVCQKANEARATTRDLWDSLFKLPSIPALSPAEKVARDAQIATVRARIAVSYADQDCKKLGPQAGKK